MNKEILHLKASVEQFDKITDKKFLINPISKADAHIVGVLIELMDKTGLTPIKNVLSKYKFLKDDEIISALEKLVKKYENDATEKKKAVLRETGEDDDWSEEEDRWFSFNDYNHFTVRKALITDFKIATAVDEKSGTEYPAIMLNECEETVRNLPRYANKMIIYGEEDDRDDDFAKLLEIV